MVSGGLAVRWHQVLLVRARLCAVIRVAGAWLLLLFGSFGQQAVAGSFVVTPVRVELSGAARSAVLTVSNNESAPLTIELRIVRWTQEEGQDQLKDSEDLLATPAVFVLAGHTSQVLRIAPRGLTAGPAEQAYRLFVEEVPQGVSISSGIQVALRMSIPVFIAPSVRLPGPLRWSATVVDDKVLLSVINDANTSVRLLKVTTAFRGSGAAEPLSLAYVLAGQQRSWLLQLPLSPGQGKRALTVRATTDAGDIDVEVPLEGR